MEAGGAPNGTRERLRAIERDVQGHDEDIRYAREQRGEMWRHITDLEKEMVAVTRDLAATLKLAGEAAENSRKTQEWVEAQMKQAREQAEVKEEKEREEKRLSRRDFWMVVGVCIALAGVIFTAIATLVAIL